MRVRRTVLISAAVLAVGAGTGAAIAATSGDDGKKAEDAVITDAAKRLNVSPDDLRSALGAAEDAQLDQAVKDGKLTQAQADAIKAHRQQDGRVLGMGPGPGPGGPHGPGGPGGPGPGAPGGPGFGHGDHGGPFGPALDAAASALGMKRADLLTQLRSGKSIADVAKANGKSTDDVKAAIKAAVTKQLDADVDAQRLTADQRTHILSELDEHLDELVNRAMPAGDRRMGGRMAGARIHRG